MKRKMVHYENCNEMILVGGLISMTMCFCDSCDIVVEYVA